MISDVLKNLRIKKRYSLKSVYDNTGISDSRLHRFEDGNIKALSIDEISILSNFYETSLESVLLESGYFQKNRIVFNNINSLTNEDCDHIQKEIDYIVWLKGKKE